MRRRAGTAQIALVGILAALGVAILYVAALVPSGRQGLAALAGLVNAAVVVSAGLPAGVFCYVSTGLLGLFLSPDKGLAVLYLIFFGLYPLVKCLIERLRKMPLEWVLKLVFFNLVLILSGFFFQRTLLINLPGEGPFLWAFYPLANLAFAAYEIGISRLISLYVVRIDKNLRRH